jgi:glycosyltransferase involved in cell wall biosynthesis
MVPLMLGRREEEYKLAAAADAVTLTSRWEGTPYSLLEAIVWARPVVATTVNGCSEIVADGETGYLVPAGDAAARASRGLTLLNDPAMAARMGLTGRERVASHFSLLDTIACTESLYQRVSCIE